MGNINVCEMGGVHKALFTWFISLVFLILFLLRADGKVDWNWFIIFIPMWLFDAAVITYIIGKYRSNSS